MKLIGDWKNFHKFWSIRLSAIGIAVSSFSGDIQNALISVWNSLPTSLIGQLPVGTSKYIGIAILAFGVVARIIDQPKLEGKD